MSSPSQMNGHFKQDRGREVPNSSPARPPFLIALTNGLLSFCLVLLLSSLGCATRPFDPGVVGPFHKLGNFYLADANLSEDVRRIAMLPLSMSRVDLSARSGRDTLQPILFGELVKSRLFEVIPVPEFELQELTGKPAWRQDEELPADFIVRIKEITACDAILFSELTHYQAYPPLAIGLRFLLVKTDGNVLWSFDEVFDAGEPGVVNSARRHALENERAKAEFTQQAGSRPGALGSVRVAGYEWINSPRHFGKYATAASIETLSIK